MDLFQDDSKSDEDAISLDSEEGDAVVLYSCGERKLSHPENDVTTVLISLRDPHPAVTEVTVFADDRPSEVSSRSANHTVISPFVSADQYDRPQAAGKTVKQLAQAYLAVQQAKEEANHVSPSFSRRFRSSGRSEVVPPIKNPFLTDSGDSNPAEVSTGECQVQESVNMNLPSLNVETSDDVTPVAPLPLTNSGTGAPDLMGGGTNPSALPEVITPSTANAIQESIPVETIPTVIPGEPADLKNHVQYPIEPAWDLMNPPTSSAQDPIIPVHDPIKPGQDSINSTQYPINPAQYPVTPVQDPINSAQYSVNAENGRNIGQDPISSTLDPINSVQNQTNPAQDPTSPYQPPTDPGQNLIDSTKHQNPTQSAVTSTPTQTNLSRQNSNDSAQEPTIPSLNPTIPTLNPSGNASSQMNASGLPPDVTYVSQDPLSSANPVPGDPIQSLHDAGLARIQIFNAACQELPHIQESLATPFESSESSFRFPDPPRPGPLVCAPVKEVKFEEPIKDEIITSQSNTAELGEIVPISVQSSHPVQNINKANEIFPTFTTTQSVSQTKDESASQANSNPNNNICEAQLNHREHEVEELEAPDQNQDGLHESSYGIIGNEENMTEITLSPLGEHNHRDPENRPCNNGYPPHRVRISIDHQVATRSRKTMVITVLLVLLLPATIVLLAAYKFFHKSPPG